MIIILSSLHLSNIPITNQQKNNFPQAHRSKTNPAEASALPLFLRRRFLACSVPRALRHIPVKKIEYACASLQKQVDTCAFVHVC